MHRRNLTALAAVGVGLAGWGFKGSSGPARADAPPPAPGAAAAPAAATAPVLDRSTGTLKQVQVVFRHGARTPVTGERYLFFDSTWGPETCGRAYEGGARLDVRGRDGLPTPPDAAAAAAAPQALPGGCCIKGELTKVGQQQALELGAWLRARYASDLGFLPPGYASGLLACRTTKFSRTRETLRGVLTGMYPGNDTPIPVVSSSDIDQLLYADSKHCPHLQVLMEASKAKLAAAMRADAHVRAELHAAIHAAIPELPQDFWTRRWTYTEIHDAVTSLQANGKAIPAGLTPEICRQINLLATRQFLAFRAPSLDDEHGHAMLRLSMGRLLDIMLDHMRAAAGAIQAAEAAEAAGGAGSSGNGDGSSSGSSSSSSSSNGGSSSADQPKMILYSGHDSTLLPILLAMGFDVASSGWPPYLSNIVIELWELRPPQQQQQQQAAAQGATPPLHPLTSDGGRFAVRVLYNREPLALPGCPPGKLMGLSTFERELLGGFILSEQDHAQACMVSLEHDSPMPQAAAQPAQPTGKTPGGRSKGSSGSSNAVEL